MKKKWLLLLAIPLLLLGIIFWALSGGRAPVDVIGELPAKDVAEITTAVKRQMRSEILPSLSWRGIKHMSKALKGYSTIKLFTLEEHGNEEVIVYVWSNTNDLLRENYMTNFPLMPAGRRLHQPNEKFLTLLTNCAHIYFVVKGTNGWDGIFGVL